MGDELPMPKLRLSRRNDGWWVLGLPHWDPEEGREGPYSTKAEANSAMSRLLRFYKSNPPYRDPMRNYEWRAGNLIPALRVNEWKPLGALVPREWTEKPSSFLEKWNVAGFSEEVLRAERIRKYGRVKVTIRRPRPRKKVRIRLKRPGKKVIVVRKRKPDPSWAELGLDF